MYCAFAAISRKAVEKWFYFCYYGMYENVPNFYINQVMDMEKDFLLSHGDLQIHCKWFAPDDGDVKRIVLGVHGIGGSTEDAIQVGIAQEMEMYYSATFRFDFPAHGQSPMGSDALTLKNCIDSLTVVAAFAREQYPEVEDLCVFATGFGAYITLVALQQLQEMPGNVKMVIQTPSVRMDETLIKMSRVSRATLQAMDKVTFHTAKPFDVTYRFYEEIHAHSAMTIYPIPMLILMGEEDNFINMEDIRQFHQFNDKSKLVIIPGASHKFLEEGAWDMVLDLTRDWFEFEQVLLADWS